MQNVRLSMPDVDPVLDRTERSLVERALAWLRTKRPRDSAVLWNQVKRVALLGSVLEQTPSLLLPTSLGSTERDAQSLVAELSHLDPMGGELPLPEKAHIARAFLLAKLTLLRSFQTALSPAAGGEPELWSEVHAELAQSVYTLIATEILVALLSEAEVPERNKRRAARQLMLIWDRAAQLEIDDFCPLLEAAWRARSRVQVRFGALLGVGEYMRLLQSDCPSEFLDFFCREDANDEETQAFEEFLFNLPHEDLVRLRTSVTSNGGGVVGAEEAARILGRPLDETTTVDDPEALYRSYRRRRTAAEFRHLSHAPGPRWTAESFIMLHVLDGWSTTNTAEYPIMAPLRPR
jgi:hypothetical protein